MQTLGNIGYQVRTSARHGGWLRKLTQVGFIAKGVMYMLIGILALLMAAEQGGETTDQRGAIFRMAQQPFGEFLLAAIAVGLFAYAIWQFLVGFANTEQEAQDFRGAVVRFGRVLSGLAHAALALYAFNVLMGASKGSDQTQWWTARLMQAPYGVFLVALTGLVVFVIGLFQMKNGVQHNFLNTLRTDQMSDTEFRWAVRVGVLGHLARGVVFGIIGLFLIFAGWDANPSEARGVEGALDAVAAQPAGNVLLGAVALGLAMYGIYCMVEARYRRINT